MKPNKAYILLFALFAIFWACDDQEQLYDLPRDPTTPMITIDGTTNLVVTDGLETGFYTSVLNWSRANYGKGISASYTMEVSDNEPFEGNKISETIGNDIYTKSLSVEQLVTWATETFGTQDTETGVWQPVTLYFRIIAKAVDAMDTKTVTSSAAAIDVSWKLTIKFKVTSVVGEWKEFAVYSWGAEEIYGSWPGKVLEQDEDGWYSFDAPTTYPINLIINDNGGGRQFDFLKDPIVSACYKFDIGDGNNNCEWTEVDCLNFQQYPSTMYMIGQAFGNWSWESEDVVAMTPVNGHEGHFWAIRYITANQGFKWCAKKEWSGDFNSLGENLGYVVSDGNAVVASDGLYMVYMNMPEGKISVESAKIYGMGDCFGGWNVGQYPFNVLGNTMAITTASAGNLRMYASATIFPMVNDWWKMEFIVRDGIIEYRGKGNDQEPVPVDAGKTVTLDFNTGTGVIQ